MAVVDGPRLAGADRHGSVAALCRLLRSRDGGVSHLGGAPDMASTSAIAYFRACHIAAHGRGRPVSGRLYSDGVFLRPAARLACIPVRRSEEHTSELQSLMRISYAVFCLKKTTNNIT